MIRPRRLLACALLPAAAMAAELPLPPLTGDLAGKLQLSGEAGFPEIAWRVQTDFAASGGPRGELTATAPGLVLRVLLTLPAAGKPGTWQIAETSVALAEWWQPAMARAGVTVRPPDLKLRGTLGLAGEGTWVGADWRGQLRVTIADAAAGSEQQRWSAEGATLDAEIAIRGKAAELHRAELRVAIVKAAGLAVADIMVDFAGRPNGRIEVTRAQLETLGGRVSVAPFAFDPLAPVVEATAQLVGVALDQVAAQLPQSLSEARGRADGQITIGWSAARGLNFGDGWLKLAEGTPASVRLAPVPGLITGQLPPNNPAHAALSRVELGRTPINLRLLHAEFHPAGDGAGRTATLRLEGEPADPALIAPLKIDVNVAGPLDQLVKLGLDDRMKVRGAP